MPISTSPSWASPRTHRGGLLRSADLVGMRLAVDRLEHAIGQQGGPSSTDTPAHHLWQKVVSAPNVRWQVCTPDSRLTVDDRQPADNEARSPCPVTVPPAS